MCPEPERRTCPKAGVVFEVELYILVFNYSYNQETIGIYNVYSIFLHLESLTSYKEKFVNLKKIIICCFYFQLEKYVFVPQVFNF